MAYKIFLPILSIIVFSLYLILIVHKYGTQKSISDSYYRLKGKYQFLFTLFIWGVTIPLMIVSDSVFFFWAGALISFVGSAPAFKKTKMESIVHIVAAAGGFSVGFIALILDFNLWWVALPAAILAAFFKKNSPYYVWFAEIIGYFALWIGVVLHIIL